MSADRQPRTVGRSVQYEGPVGTADPVAWYDANAETVSARYEETAAEDIHAWLLDLLPAIPATVLDVGAGSGRDAAWPAAKGFQPGDRAPGVSQDDQSSETRGAHRA
jgi:hypothetical protein